MPLLTSALLTPAAHRALAGAGLASGSWPGLFVVALTLWSAALALGRILLRAAGASGAVIDTLAQAYGPTMRVLLALDAAAGLLLVVSLGAVAMHLGRAASRRPR